MIIVLFGKTGSGKSFIANILHKDYGFPYLEGDSFFTDEMMAIINKGGVISQELRDEFVHSMIAATLQAERDHDNVVLAQLFLSDKNRRQVQQSIPEAIWIYVDVTPHIRFSRLQARKGHFADIDYAKKMDVRFEPITIGCQKINNDRNAGHIKSQLNAILGGGKP